MRRAYKATSQSQRRLLTFLIQQRKAARAIMAEANSTCMSAGTEDFVGLKVGGLFAIMAASAVGVAVPFYTYSILALQPYYFILRAFAAGVVLCTGFVHILGDAYPLLTDPCLGLSGTYPWAMTFATAAALSTFTLEWTLRKWIHHLHALKISGKVNRPCNNSPSKNDEEAGVEAARLAERRETLEAVVIAISFETGIVFHSIFVGITLGIAGTRNTVVALMIALCFHQANEGLALGVLSVKARYSALRYTFLAAIFVVITPIGTAIGIALGQKYNGSSKAALGTEGVFDSISAGILIYNGLVDLIVPTFSDRELPRSALMVFLGFVALFGGAAIMALIGKWV